MSQARDERVRISKAIANRGQNLQRLVLDARGNADQESRNCDQGVPLRLMLPEMEHQAAREDDQRGAGIDHCGIVFIACQRQEDDDGHAGNGLAGMASAAPINQEGGGLCSQCAEQVRHHVVIGEHGCAEEQVRVEGEPWIAQPPVNVEPAIQGQRWA